MSQPYVGQIMMFAGTFAPAGWMTCQGQTLPISENETLFDLIGTTYGGDGQETFQLPDLQGRVAVHQGQGGGLSNYVIGQSGGTENVTLTVQQIPSHNHSALTLNGTGGSSSKVTNATVFADQSADVPGGGALYCYTTPGGSQVAMAPTSIGQGPGGNQPHNNIQPVMTVTYIISLFGAFPSPT